MVLPSALQTGLGVWQPRACLGSEYLWWLKDAALGAGPWSLTSVLPVAHCGLVAEAGARPVSGPSLGT